MDKLIKYINKYVKGIDSSQIEKILTENFQLKSLTKGEHLVVEGQACRYLCFINQGTLRYYYLKEGTEISTWFCFSEEFVTAFESFVLQVPSKEAIAATSSCELLCISYQSYTKLLRESLIWEKVSRVLTIHYAIQQERRIYMLQTLNAKEKYQYLLTHYPHIIQAIPGKYIASYLGISRETLSRIRAQYH